MIWDARNFTKEEFLASYKGPHTALMCALKGTGKLLHLQVLGKNT